MRSPLHVYNVPLFLVLIAACGGCFGDSQKGKFAVAGSQSRALANHPGSLTILRGHALTSDYQPTGADAPVIYFLIVCPGLQSNGSESEAIEGSYRSTHTLTWFATPNDVTIEFTWDRNKDNLEIHGAQYKRSNGNVFVVVRGSDGKVSSWQVESIEDDVDYKDVMKHIREKLPHNKLIADLNLVERGTK